MGGIFLRMKVWWETADRTQRVVTIFGSIFLVFLLAATYSFASRPKLVLLYSGLQPGDLGKVSQEIQKLGVEYDFDPAGNVRVASDKVAEVHARLLASGSVPAGAHVGNEALASIGMMSAKDVQSAQLIAIQEGEIAKSLETLGIVQSAKVLINPGKEGGFADESEPATASVIVAARNGADLGPEQGRTIAQIVAKGGVSGLTEKNVTVADQNGATIYDGSEMQNNFGKFASKGEAQYAEARRVKRELQDMLDKAYGPGNTMALVRVEMDFDTTSQKIEKSDPSKDPTESVTTSESLTPGSSTAGGIPGPTGAPTGGSGSGSYVGKTEQTRFSTTTTHEERVKAPGTVTSMSLAVLADSENVKETKPIEDLLTAYIQPKLQGQDASNFAIKVTPVKFNRTAEVAAKKAGEASAGADKMQQYFSLIPVVALVLVGFLVLKSIGKVAKGQNNVLVQALPAGAIPGQLALAGGGGGGTAGYVASGGSGTRQAHEAIDDDEDEDQPIKVGKIADRLNVPLEQIKKMAADKPATVAMLLKSWLLEDRP